MSTVPAHGSLVLVTWALWWREMARFFRQPSRIIGAIATPLVFWVLVGSGLGKSFRPPTQDQPVSFMQYALPGTLVLIVLFTAIFSTMSTIEDRREGFLQSVLVAPASRFSIALGKVLGGATIAVAQAMIFVILMPLVGLSLSAGSVACTLGALALVAFSLAGMGFLFAWQMNSTQGFHAIMNLVLMPMWLLSGAFFPQTGASPWMAAIIRLNPLTYGVGLVRYGLHLSSGTPGHGAPSLTLCLWVTILFAALMVAGSGLVVGRTRPR
ncbi:MAG: ABC transporter permease [Phycisphaerae bacterium]